MTVKYNPNIVIVKNSAAENMYEKEGPPDELADHERNGKEKQSCIRLRQKYSWENGKACLLSERYRGGNHCENHVQQNYECDERVATKKFPEEIFSLCDRF